MLLETTWLNYSFNVLAIQHTKYCTRLASFEPGIVASVAFESYFIFLFYKVCSTLLGGLGGIMVTYAFSFSLRGLLEEIGKN